MLSRGGGLPGADLGCLPDHVHIPGAAQGQGDGEDGPVAVDHVRHEQKGDFQTAVFQMPPLDIQDGFRIEYAQDAARRLHGLPGDAQLVEGTGDVRLGVLLEKETIELGQLGRFFLQGHFLKQCFNAFGCVHTGSFLMVGYSRTLRKGA